MLLGFDGGYAQQLKIMSYNIHHGQDVDNKDQLEEMARFVKEMKPDIVALQEVDSVCRRSGGVDQAKFLGEETGMYAVFLRHFSFEGGAYGQALLSRYPIGKVRNIRLPTSAGTSTALLAAEVEAPSRGRVLMLVAHLDYRSASSRQVQAKQIVDVIKSSALPVVLAGDMNAEPGSEEVKRLMDGLHFHDMGSQPTFPASLPEKKIDYIMFDKKLNAKRWKTDVFPVLFSDHLPIMCTLDLK